MSIILWDAWSPQWLAGSKVDFDGSTKHILVHPEVTSLDIRSDLYSSWVKWLDLSEDSQKWPLAMKYSGLDAIPGGETGGVFFLINGWKLIIDFNKVAVSGVLYSENYSTAYWSVTEQPLYPAVVSSLVNTVVQTQTITVAANPAEIAAEILATPVTTPMSTGSLGEFLIKKVLTVAKFIGLK